MAELPLSQSITRFKQNESKVDRFANGSETETWASSDGTSVPSIRKFLKDKDTEINVASNSVLARATLASEAAETAQAAVEADRIATEAARVEVTSARDDVEAMVERIEDGPVLSFNGRHDDVVLLLDDLTVGRATLAQIGTGTDDQRFVTPHGMRNSIGLRLINKTLVETPTSLIRVSIPSDVHRLYIDIDAYATVDNLNSCLGMQFSLNGGVTYAVSTLDYIISNHGIWPPKPGGHYISLDLQSALIQLAGARAIGKIPIVSSTVMSPGGVGKHAIATSKAFTYEAYSSGSQLADYAGMYQTPGRVTDIQFFMGAGNQFGVGSQLAIWGI